MPSFGRVDSAAFKTPPLWSLSLKVLGTGVFLPAVTILKQQRRQDTSILNLKDFPGAAAF